jgi:hypothetical protein
VVLLVLPLLVLPLLVLMLVLPVVVLLQEPLVWCRLPLLLQQAIWVLLHQMLLCQQGWQQLGPGSCSVLLVWTLQQHHQLQLQQPWRLCLLLSLLQPVQQLGVS